MKSEFLEAIENSEMVLVGIGEEFSPKLPEFSGDPAMEPYERSRYYADLPSDHAIIRAYNELRSLIGKRPFFVVTLNTDDLIYRSEFEREQIVAPCGSMGKMQCKEHILDAGPIRDRVLAAGSVEGQALCPVCGASLQFHTVEQEGYLEDGYLSQWERYKKWLTGTLNRKLCVLELGVGFAFPQVIRWPFERTAYYNKKAVFVRVHSRFPQTEAELAGKAVSIAQSPVELLLQ